MRKLVIIPTYNEKQNIENVISQVFDLKIAQLDILVIDDYSPDGTAQLVEKIMRQNSKVFLLKRAGKLGLGTAYIAGFKWAIEKGYDAAVEMDADLSHDPKVLNNLFVQSENFDFVIGSRYVDGGGVVNWPFKRRLLSRLGSLYARLILGVKIHDFTGGYNLWNRAVLKKIGLNEIKSEGYSFQIEMKYRAVKAGFKFTEVPIIFNDRVRGASKMSTKIFKEAIWRVWWLRGKNLINMFRKWTIKQKLLNLSLLIFSIFLVSLRCHNAWSFNPYWGYDSVGHLDYILSLAKRNAFPDIAGNYIAWHEPLYYLILAFFSKIYGLLGSFETKSYLHFLSVLQALLSLATSFLVYKVAKLLSSSKGLSIIAVVWFSLMPSFTQASTFITNELLNCFFCFLIIWYVLKNFSLLDHVSYQKFSVLGILFGLALLTKITAAVVIAVVCVYLVFSMISGKSFKLLKGTLVALAIAAIIYAPWLVYRSSNVLDSFSINNTNFLKPKSLVLDDRVRFFGGFDTGIFTNPNFKSGAAGFWSMLYAETFYDYYGGLENEDYLARIDKHQLVDVAKEQATPFYVSKSHYNLNRILVYLGLPLALFMLFGLIYNVIEFFKKRGVKDFLMAGAPLAFLAAQIYYAYRYPYFDFGVIKSIFILPAYLFLMIGSLLLFRKIKPLFAIYLVCLTGYLILSIPLVWLDKFNY